ncbi:MAG TPA: hypothetical protein VKA46_07215 [Gemmataceae bacterium]|nr:hypothetical protein [Gemmataceae bacterium]
MKRPQQPLLAIVFFAALLGSPTLSSAFAADPLPEGARACLVGEGRFRHKAWVTWVAPLPDGKRLLTMTNDQRLHVWDIAGDKQEFEIVPTAQSGTFVFVLSPDRKSLVTAASADRVIRTWDLANGKELRQFPALPAEQGFYDLDWSPDGKSLVSYHHDRILRIWDAVSGKKLRQLPLARTTDPDASDDKTAGLLVRFMPDSKSLAIVEGWAVRVIDPEDGKELRWFGHGVTIRDILFSPDGKLLATVGYGRQAPLWNWRTGKAIATLPLPLGANHGLAFGGDGKIVAVGAADRTIRVFDAASARQVGKIEHGGVAANGFTLSNDGKTLYLCPSGERCLRTYDVSTGKEGRSWSPSQGSQPLYTRWPGRPTAESWQRPASRAARSSSGTPPPARSFANFPYLSDMNNTFYS